MIIEVLTLFPEMFSSPLKYSIIGKALEKGHLTVTWRNIRDYTKDKHHQVDDRPFGGGSGMLMKPEPLAAAIDSVKDDYREVRIVLLTPQGELFNQQIARRLSSYEYLTLVCGRYEGVDERIRKYWVDEELSIGDYVLSGGELAALVIIDAVARLIPGVLGDDTACEEDSFATGLLEYPQYTRPRDFRGHRVPEVLLSGNHQVIQQWRREQSLKRTRERRPELLEKISLSCEEKESLKALGKCCEETGGENERG